MPIIGPPKPAPDYLDVWMLHFCDRWKWSAQDINQALRALGMDVTCLRSELKRSCGLSRYTTPSEMMRG